jgi:NitT/TauT family transport system permease protein
MSVDAPKSSELDRQLQGLDKLDIPETSRPSVAARVWRATWPKLGAVAIALVGWQVVVWSGWKPEYLLPGPGRVFSELWEMLRDGTVTEAAGVTLQRALYGFALALLIGTVVGALVSRVRIARSAFGSLITGLQTMPSVAWVPLAILLFPFDLEQAIFFVVVLGAAPSIANGLITGVDHMPPALLRAGRVLGARGVALFRHVILPAAMPSYIAGLKQGWAFAWRSLMAGELIVTVQGRHSLGSSLDHARQLNQSAALLAWMIVILAIGVVVDSLFFGTLERSLLRRRGLSQPGN